MLRRILKWLLWCAAILIFMVSIGAAALWVLPWAVSTDWAKEQIETRALRALHAPVTLDSLQWTWGKGIHIEGLRIADQKGFGPGPIISLDRFTLELDPGQLLDKRLYLDLEMEGLKAHVVRTADGRTNLETWLARLQPAGKPAEETRPSKPQDWRSMVLALPGDLDARLSLQHGALFVEDRQANRSLTIHDIALLVDVPSLVSRPITATLSSEQELDGKRLPPVELALSIKDLVDPSPAVQLKTASINARCRLPGFGLNLSGGLSDMGMEGEMNLDLAALMSAAGPLVPPGLPSVSGEIGLFLKARMGPKDKIAYDITLSGERLMVEGGSLKEREIGPVALRFDQTGTIALEKRELQMAKGQLQIQEKTRIGWKGRVRQTNGSSIETDLVMADIALDLKEMAGLAGPFLPVDITAACPENGPHRVAVEQATISGILPAGKTRVALKGVKMELACLDLSRAANGLSVQGVGLRMPEVDVGLQELFPASLDVIADLDIERFSLQKDRAISVRGLRVADIHITATNLVPSPKALLGVAGSVNVTESATMEKVNAPGLAAIPGVVHNMKASVRMQDQSPFIQLSGETAVEAQSLQFEALSKKPVKGGMRLGVEIKDLHVKGLTPLMADVGGADASLRLGEAVKLNVQVAAADLGEKALSLRGKAKLDLNAAASLIPPSVKAMGTFAGILESDWRIEGRRPTPDEQKTLSDPKRSLAERLNAVEFVHVAELHADLHDVGLNLGMKEGKRVSVQGVRSVSPLTVALSGGLKSVRLEGDLHIGRISELPGSKPFDPPLPAGFSFKIHQEDLSSLEISEAVQIDPLEIDQGLQISITRLGRLLNSKESPTIAGVLKHLDVSVEADLRTTLGPSLAAFTPGLSMTGPLDAGLKLELSAGKEIGASLSLESKGLDVNAEKARIEGLTSHIHLSKAYQLRFEGEGQGRKEAASGRLSRIVLRSSRASDLLPPSGDALARRLIEDLGGSLSGPPTLSFDAVTFKKGPLPLKLHHGEIQLRLVDSLPSLDRFQVDAMGGSVLGHLRLARRGDLCALEMEGAFSGLDAATLLPKQAAGEPRSLQDQGRESQISGQVFLNMPISRESVHVMNNLSAGIRLTHIGSRTLERLLYAMDPYEANEGIVKQRAILRKGSPEWVDFRIRNGNLSLSGAVTAMGSRIALPRVERINLTNLPIHDRLEKALDRLGPVEKGLKALSAESIMIRNDSSMEFVQER